MRLPLSDEEIARMSVPEIEALLIRLVQEMSIRNMQLVTE